MNRWSAFTTAGAMATLLSTTSAFADVSNQDVWSTWKGVLTGVGYDVAGQESQSGNSLTVSDLVLSIDLAPEEGSVSMNFGEMTFEEQGDGTVRIGLPATLPVKIVSDVEGEQTDVTLTATMDGLDMVASGDPDDITYTYSANSMAMALTELLVNGQPMDDFTFDMMMSAMSGVSSIGGGDMARFAQTMTANSLTMKVKGDDPDDGKVDMNMDIQGLAFESEGVVPMGVDHENPAEIFRSGFNMQGSFSAEGSTLVVDAEEDQAPTKINMSTATSKLAVTMGDGLFDYDGSVVDVAFSMVGGGSPLPIVVNMDELSYGLLMPLLKGTSPQDFDFSFKLAGLTISDMLWGIFDPGGMLPRDPATISVALNGTTTLFEDLVSEEMEDADEFPGEVNSLTLTEVLVEAVGARISGDGGFVFDNTDLQTFDGIPRPEGSVALNVKGANALMDTLVAMGLLPEEQVMGARMMMAMFSVPGDSEDEVNSVIEINAEGHVLANGQRIQ
ncbi:hypothetical protein SAMN05444000_11660 [Shimia gijangensis]|uniref:DUF2125 domain-containing protein n=1 Tax=Shimia gijangensis TaxID=1470563 RepID=A0A1M6NPD4_9RHOB|nr:DUF2125 domain-containing protein [Shimia gijangensis]SHJ97528.1 hypothetical protein SAMN05444000_11660 [Shimia gijangensis]